uniref:Uncharacterized protein n=2 Tax=Lepeophtheirus salmonis TaxID=72036 RepID=A0A0K2SZV5_LEPSM
MRSRAFLYFHCSVKHSSKLSETSMLGRNKPVYQPTTYQVNGGSKRTSSYLPTSNNSFCGGKKRRLQLVFLSFGIILICLGVVAFGSSLSGLYSSSLTVGVIILALLFLLFGGWMVVLYLRTRGKCNFSFWPNRAAVLSQQLTANTELPTRPRGSQEEESLMPSSEGGPTPTIVASSRA